MARRPRPRWNLTTGLLVIGKDYVFCYSLVVVSFGSVIIPSTGDGDRSAIDHNPIDNRSATDAMCGWLILFAHHDLLVDGAVVDIGATGPVVLTL